MIQSVFLDIDERKKAEQRSQLLAEQVEASNQILHVALEHTTNCEFFYDPQTETCTVPARTCAIYHCRDRYEHMPESFAEEQIAEAFHPAFFEMYERIHHGEHTASCEFCGIDGKFWCRETLSVIRWDKDGTPQFVIGIVEDITREKAMELALDEARSRDNLTGLYNKERGIALIQNYLSGRSEGEHGVLMLLDMDDFKRINQREGRIFADGILQEVADILRAESEPDHIPIRLGGDEFMIFFKHSDKANACVTGPRIANQVQNILANAEQNIHVSRQHRHVQHRGGGRI